VGDGEGWVVEKLERLCHVEFSDLDRHLKVSIFCLFVCSWRNAKRALCSLNVLQI
jgi:hypothetical protein